MIPESVRESISIQWHLQAVCFRLTSLIFRTCLCCVYSLSFPGHFGNSNLSLSLITHNTHSASGLGLPECLICCFLLQSYSWSCKCLCGCVLFCVVGSVQYSHQQHRVLMCPIHSGRSHANLSTSCLKAFMCGILLWKSVLKPK